MIVLWAVVSVLIYENTSGYELTNVSRLKQHSNVSYGWPFPIIIHYRDTPNNKPIFSIGDFITVFFLFDLAIWLLLLASATVICEFWARKFRGRARN